MEAAGAEELRDPPPQALRDPGETNVLPIYTEEFKGPVLCSIASLQSLKIVLFLPVPCF